MNKINRKKVERELGGEDTNTLRFCTYNYSSNYWSSGCIYELKRVVNPKISDELSLRDVVYKILQLSRKYGSYNPHTKKVETDKGRNRSSLDIWRHVIYYRKRTSIYSVMKALYQLRNDLEWLYCHDVERMVFCVDESELDTNDEYGLQFKDWKNI